MLQKSIQQKNVDDIRKSGRAVGPSLISLSQKRHKIKSMKINLALNLKAEQYFQT